MADCALENVPIKHIDRMAAFQPTQAYYHSDRLKKMPQQLNRFIAYLEFRFYFYLIIWA